MNEIATPYHFDIEYFQIEAPQELIRTIEATVRSSVPHVQFGSGTPLVVEVKWGQVGCLSVAVKLGEEVWSFHDTEITDRRYTELDGERRVKERVRAGIKQLLEQRFSLSASPWGILTGVRPTKLVHALIDRGFSELETNDLLGDVYGISQSKSELLQSVVKKQRAYFQPEPNNPVSVYIGIPFCPTRCSYCSFAAYPLRSHGHLLGEFLRSLQEEIKAVGKLLRELDIRVETVYLGGGTPTTVQGDRLEELLGLIRSELITSGTKEFTVEAGRPETLNLRCLEILKRAKVDRISINPQTMHDSTLKLIGRDHSVEQVYSAYQLAREVGFSNINMDIILGLPQETIKHVEETLGQLAKLQPENLTVHSLALKRASRLKKQGHEVQIAQKTGEVMAELAAQFAKDWGMEPYYLYRQRYILGDLENIGYAKPGYESIYNIQMMEERQTIIGLGGGGMTKLVEANLRLTRIANAKCPATYSQQMGQELEGKINQIRKHLIV